jgi:hypothetical protein
VARHGADWCKKRLEARQFVGEAVRRNPGFATVHDRFSPTDYIPAMVFVRLMLAALALMVVGPLSVVPAEAEPRMRCLTRDQQRAAITERRAVPLAAVRNSVRAKVPG